MQTSSTTLPHTIPIRNGVLALTGYGIRVSVNRRELCVEDGIGRTRRQGRFAKATSKLKRLLILGETGQITLDALTWLDDIGAAFLRIDHKATLLTTSLRGVDDAKLRRTQAILPMVSTGLAIAKKLLVPKIANQSNVLASFGLDQSDEVRQKSVEAEEAPDFRLLLQAERQAADLYWGAWAKIPVQFSLRDRPPQHWQTFGTRGSPLDVGAYNAINPMNALLNYLYALLEIETRLALLSRGLDPGMGIFHVDTPNRQSFATDVMEPIRPHVDAYVLNLIRTRTFGVRDFFEKHDGGCRISSSLTRELASSMGEWAKLVAPFAEMVWRHVSKASTEEVQISYPSARKNVRKVSSKRLGVSVPAFTVPEVKKTVPMERVYNACRHCGKSVTVRRRIYCDACYVEWRKSGNFTFLNRTAVKEEIAQCKALDDSPNSQTARQKRAKSASVNRIAVSNWQDDGSLDEVNFEHDIFPGLQQCMVKDISYTTGLTRTYASQIRAGKAVPHKRHWVKIMELIKKKAHKHEE
jgi:CRISPR-associated endonuclease Cas1